MSTLSDQDMINEIQGSLQSKVDPWIEIIRIRFGVATNLGTRNDILEWGVYRWLVPMIEQ